MPRKKPTSPLIEALIFILAAQKEKDIGPANFCYCHLSNGFVTASDGVVTASHPIEENLEAKPHTKKLLSALQNCGKKLSITQKNDTLTIRSGRYFATIPCYNDELLPFNPDESVVPLNDSIKHGFKKIGFLALENGQNIAQCSVLIKSGSMIATNAVVAVEYWHGLDMPTVVVPKAFVTAIAKTKKSIHSMGFSKSSVTFWLEEGSWLKTQLFLDPWPDMTSVFNMPEDLTPEPIPKMLYKAIEAVEEFAPEGKDKGQVYLSDAGVCSHPKKGIGASYELKGLRTISFNIKQLKHIRTCCDTIAFGEKLAWFFSENMRGVIASIFNPEAEEVDVKSGKTSDEVPF